MFHMTLGWAVEYILNATKAVHGVPSLFFMSLCWRSSKVDVDGIYVFTALLAGGLSVVHIVDNEISILELLEITDSHVAVDVPHISAFGLAWNCKTKISKPIQGQILLFLPKNPKTQKQNLILFLLPKNVPLEEVKTCQMLQLHFQFKLISTALIRHRDTYTVSVCVSSFSLRFCGRWGRGHSSTRSFTNHFQRLKCNYTIDNKQFHGHVWPVPSLLHEK